MALKTNETRSRMHHLLLATGAGLALSFTAAPVSAAERPQAGVRQLGLSAICDGCKLEVFARCDGLLEGPSAGPDGALYLSSPSRGRIYKVTNDGKCTLALEQPAAKPSFRPGGTKFHKDGRLFGTNIHTNEIFVFDPRKNELTFLNASDAVHGGAASSAPPNTGYHGFNDLVFDETGGIYFSDMAGSSALRPEGRIVYRTPGGELLTVVPTGLALPDGIALSPDGKTLYIGEWLSNRIISVPVIKPGEVQVGMASVFAYLQGGRGPDGMTIDAKGNLYVAHQGAGGEISVFAPDGSYYGSIGLADGADFSPTNLAFEGDYLYVTEGRPVADPQNGSAVWRVRTKTGAPKLYGDQ